MLERFGRKIVVVVDDLDRVAPTEVAAMVQAVKAVADFPNVVYLLAYDANNLAHALEQALRVENGRAYLDKILQVPVSLPELPARRLQAFAEQQLRESVSPLTTSAGEGEDIERAVAHAAALLQTPRDVWRMQTILGLRAQALRGEVNLGDVVVAEAICLKTPEFIPWMRRHGRLLLVPGVSQFDSWQQARAMHEWDRESVGESREQREQRIKEQTTELTSLGTHDGAARDAYRRALEYLFDGTNSTWIRDDRRSSYLRLQRFRHYYRWRCLCDSQEPASILQIQSWAARPSELLTTEWLGSREAFLELSTLVRDITDDSITVVDAAGWAQLFIELERRFSPEFVIGWDVGHGPLPTLIALLRCANATDRESAIVRLVESASIALCARVLHEARDDLLDPSHAQFRQRETTLVADEARIDQLQTVWWRRADEYLRASTWVAAPPAVAPYTHLAWMQHASRPTAELAALAEELLGAHGDAAAAFFGSDLSGSSERFRAFSMQLAWAVLPDARTLESLVAPSSSLAQSHPHLLERIRAKAAALPERNQSE